MNNKYIYFGEQVDGYNVKVLNEREARAGAGILFLFGFISFINSLLLHNFTFTKIFVTVFMVDFMIRIFINPKFSPSLLLGRIMIQNQIPEYVAAPQKKWAWYIGLYLSIIMFILIVILEVMTPIKLVICILCLVLLFSESAFGICIGCKFFNAIYKEKATLCPGGVCEIRKKEEIQTFSILQKIIIVLFILIVSTIVYKSTIKNNQLNNTVTQNIETNKTNTIPSTMKCAVGKCGAGMK
jgi:hypothetical protein